MARTYNSGWRDWFNTRDDNAVSDNFVVTGLAEQKKQLDELLSKSPEMEQRIQKIIRKVLAKARRQMQSDIHRGLPNDPREAYKAVRMVVYRRILGGNINILQKKRATGGGTYMPPRTLKSGQRGGNRKQRNERTIRMDSYKAGDRGFILRFLNAGTNGRAIRGFATDSHRTQVRRGSQGGDVNKYGSLGKANTGNRGRLREGNIFGAHLIALGKFIDSELVSEFNDMLDTVTADK